MEPWKESQSPPTNSNRATRRGHPLVTTGPTIANSQDRIIRKPEARQITGMSDTTIWRMEKEGKFPKRLRLGGSACGWLLSEINAWLAERAAARV